MLPLKHHQLVLLDPLGELRRNVFYLALHHALGSDNAGANQAIPESAGFGQLGASLFLEDGLLEISLVDPDILAEAKRVNDRIYPLARVFYADPWADMHNRMKEALVLLGRLPRAVVRPPLVKLSRAEIDRIRAALIEAGLLAAKASRDAA